MLQQENIELERVRYSYGLYFEDGEWCGYRIDVEVLAPVLSKYVGRETLKEKLSLLNPDFKMLFSALPMFRTTKEENRYLYRFLKNLYTNGISSFRLDVERIQEGIKDVIYDESLQAETKLYDLYSKMSSPIYLEAKQAEKDFEDAGIQFVSIVDKETETETQKIMDSLSYTVYGLSRIIEILDGYYAVEGVTETQRKQEQRHRDELFCYIVVGLCYYYDCYLPTCLKGEDGLYPEKIKQVRATHNILEFILLYELVKTDDFINSIKNIEDYKHLSVSSFTDEHRMGKYERVLFELMTDYYIKRSLDYVLDKEEHRQIELDSNKEIYSHHIPSDIYDSLYKSLKSATEDSKTRWREYKIRIINKYNRRMYSQSKHNKVSSKKYNFKY